MATTTSQVETWSAFYNSNKEEIPTLQAAYEMSFEHYDTMTQALNQLGDELVLRTATLPHNFMDRQTKEIYSSCTIASRYPNQENAPSLSG